MRIVLLAVVIAGGLLCSMPVRGADFRVENTTFAGTKKEPVGSSITLFHVGVVYDYLNDPPQVAILDPARGRFILLDINSREKAAIKIQEVAAFGTNMQTWAAKAPNLFVKFAANPKFEVILDPKTEELSFNSPSIIYRVKGVKAPSPDEVKQYREFSDWYVRLNAMTNPAVLPPFPRMAVNEELANRGLLPESVALNVPKQLSLGGRGMSLHSEHIVTWRLLQKDLDNIASTGSQMADFSEIPFADYVKSRRK